MIFLNAGSNGFTGPEERNGESEGSAAGDTQNATHGRDPMLMSMIVD